MPRRYGNGARRRRLAGAAAMAHERKKARLRLNGIQCESSSEESSESTSEDFEERVSRPLTRMNRTSTSSSLFPSRQRSRSPSVQSRTVRPRHLDLDRPLIILNPSESEAMCREEIAAGLDFSLAAEDFANLTEEGASFETDAMVGTIEFNILAQSVKEHPTEIHVPKYRVISTSKAAAAGGGPWIRQQRGYITFSKTSSSSSPIIPESRTQYEMDVDDARFLAKYNELHPPITEELFERVIGRLELEAATERLKFSREHFAAMKVLRANTDRLNVLCDVVSKREKLKMARLQCTAQERETMLMDLRKDTLLDRVAAIKERRSRHGVCQVCFTNKGNLEVCYSCGVAVHLACYGPGHKQADTWTCDWCHVQKGVSRPRGSCELCPIPAGALKRTTAGKWIHATCALFLPDVVVMSDEANGFAINTSTLKKARKQAKCIVCKKSTGACAYCDHDSCHSSMHIMCAIREGHHVCVIPDGQASIPCLKLPHQRGRPELKDFTIYCREHTPLPGMDPVAHQPSDMASPDLGMPNLELVGNHKIDIRKYVVDDEEEFVDIESVDAKSIRVDSYDPLHRLFMKSPAHIERMLTPQVTKTRQVDFDEIEAARKRLRSHPDPLPLPPPVPKPPKQYHSQLSTVQEMVADGQSLTPELIKAVTKCDRWRHAPTGDVTLCAVCHDGESYKGDAIIFCDGCNMPVHQSCYGVPQVPVGDWFCARCAAGAPRVRCVLCPIKTGPFKRLDNGEWVHVVCALWMPGVYFENPDTMEGVRGIDKVDPTRYRLTCCICRKKDGACIQCKVKRCTNSFHVGCMRRSTSGFIKIVQNSKDEIGYYSYCKDHKDVGIKEVFRVEMATVNMKSKPGKHTTPQMALSPSGPWAHDVSKDGLVPTVVTPTLREMKKTASMSMTPRSGGRYVCNPSYSKFGRRLGRPPLSATTTFTPKPQTKKTPTPAPPVVHRQTRVAVAVLSPDATHRPGLSHFVPSHSRKSIFSPPRWSAVGPWAGAGSLTAPPSPFHIFKQWDKRYLTTMVTEKCIVSDFNIKNGPPATALFNYWLQKRLRTGMPLLARYQPAGWDDREIFQPFDMGEHPAYDVV